MFHVIKYVRRGNNLAVVAPSFLCLRLLVFLWCLVLVATPKNEALLHARTIKLHIRCHFGPLGAVQCINAHLCGSFSIRHTGPALSPLCYEVRLRIVWRVEVVRCCWLSIRSGGRPQPHPKAVPLSGCEHANCPANPQGYSERWRCPRPCVYAGQRWRPPQGLSAPIVGLFRLAPRCGAGAVPQCGPPSIFCRGPKRGAPCGGGPKACALCPVGLRSPLGLLRLRRLTRQKKIAPPVEVVTATA